MNFTQINAAYPTFTKQAWESIGSGKQFVQVDWTFTYDNGFGRRIDRPASECLAYLDPVKAQAMTHHFGPTLSPCDGDFDQMMTAFLQSRKDTNSR